MRETRQILCFFDELRNERAKRFGLTARSHDNAQILSGAESIWKALLYNNQAIKAVLRQVGNTEPTIVQKFFDNVLIVTKLGSRRQCTGELAVARVAFFELRTHQRIHFKMTAYFGSRY
ncbi:hypothetical protein N9C96_00530 [bacterium]|nr:hypothetical protein [bacterium]